MGQFIATCAGVEISFNGRSSANETPMTPETDRQPVAVFVATVARWGEEIGYNRQECEWGSQVTPERIARRREFVLESSDSECQQLTGRCTIAFMDESDLHMNYRNATSTFPDDKTSRV